MAKSATSVWEIRPTAGNDNNGGGFDASIASAGTDYSQQNAAQLNVTDLVGNGTTTLTSVTGGFTAAMIANALWQNGDTDRYFITAVGSTNSITVDRATGTFTAKTCNVGGALATNNEAFSARGGVGGNVFWLKASGTLAVAGAQTSPPSGTGAARTLLIGYNATRSVAGATISSDLDAVNDYSNFPLIQANNVSNACLLISTNFVTIRNVVGDGGTGGTQASSIFSVSGTDVIFENFKAIRFTTNGLLNTTAVMTLIRGYVTSNVSGATAGLNIDGGALTGCVVTGLSCTGVTTALALTVNTSIIANNTGATSDGLVLTGGATTRISNSVLYGNGRDNLRVSGAAVGDDLIIRNTIIVSAGATAATAYGLDSVTTNYGATSQGKSDYCFWYNNKTADVLQWIKGKNDVTLTGDPFVSGSTGNFALNSTAGAGAAVKAAGWPGVMPAGLTTGSMSGGVAQVAASGGGATARIIGG